MLRQNTWKHQAAQPDPSRKEGKWLCGFELAHRDGHISRPAACIDGEVAVQVVPGASREVSLCGIHALVDYGRNQQRITYNME